MSGRALSQPPQTITDTTEKSALAVAPGWPRGIVAPAKRAALASLLQPGEIVLWTGSADARSTLRTQLVLWAVGLPYMVTAAALFYFGRIAADWQWFVLMPGAALIAAPILLAAYAGGTLYAITDRRAIIKHDALGKQQTVSVAFADMDEKFEILPVRPGIGHLYFASGLPTRLSNVDYTGKLAFRELAKPEEVAALLERIRAHWQAARV